MEAVEEIVAAATETTDTLPIMRQNIQMIIQCIREANRRGLFHLAPDASQPGAWIDQTNLNEYLFGGHGSRAQLEQVERIMFDAARNA